MLNPCNNKEIVPSIFNIYKTDSPSRSLHCHSCYSMQGCHMHWWTSLCSNMVIVMDTHRIAQSMIDFVVISFNHSEKEKGWVNRSHGGGLDPLVGEEIGQTQQPQTYCESLLRNICLSPLSGRLATLPKIFWGQCWTADDRGLCSGKSSIPMTLRWTQPSPKSKIPRQLESCLEARCWGWTRSAMSTSSLWMLWGCFGWHASGALHRGK